MKTSKRTSIRGRGRVSGGRVVRLSAVALVVLMLAMAVMPLSPNGVSAKNDDFQITSNVINNTNVNVDLQVATETPDDPIDLDVDDLVAVTVEPTLDDPIAVGAVQINKLGCDDDYDGDYYQLAANCYAMDAPFTVSSGAGDAAYNGSFTDDQVVAGSVSVTEEIPDGYGEPFIFCDSYFADASESGFSQFWASNGELQHDLQGGEWFYCDWFNVPGDLHNEDTGDGSIYINKHVCPADYNADGKTYYDLAADCQGTLNGVKFNLTLEDNLVESKTTGDDIDSAVNFEGLYPSAYSVEEEIPVGYGEPVVFCTNNSLTEDVLAEYYQPEVEQGKTDLELNEGEYIFCDWFNLPAKGTITIHKWLCPVLPAFVELPTVDEMKSACDTTGNGFIFDLSYPNDPQNPGDQGVTGDDGDGTLIFEGVDDGSIEIAEEIPSGYGDPMVSCGWGAIYDQDGEGGNPPVAIDGYIPLDTVPDGVLVHDMYPGEVLSCDWFNFPHDGSIDIYKFDCPEGFDAYNANLDDLQVHCDQPMSGIDFTLKTNADDLVGVENTDGSGFAGFTDVDAGTNYLLSEAMPTGYGTPIVYCYELEGEAVQYDVYTGESESTIELAYGQGKIVCFWFNVPYDGGSITIYKYTCPAGYDLYAWNADPEHDCTDLTNGIDFTLYGSSIADLTTTTGDSIPGAVYWGGLEWDSYTVAEDAPAGTYQTFVACQWSEELGPYYYNQFTPYTNGDYAVGNRIDLDLPEGNDITCWWYNAPEDHDGGDLVVIKYWCDGNIYDEQHCDLYGGGADFGIESASGQGDPVYFTTGGDGTAHLYLSSGNYDLWETDRQWCKAESDQVNGNGEVVIYDGQTSYVTVFNCGPGREKEPPVKKFPNTGVAPMAMTSGGGINGTYFLIAVGGTVLLLGIAGTTVRKASVAVRTDRIG